MLASNELVVSLVLVGAAIGSPAVAQAAACKDVPTYTVGPFGSDSGADVTRALAVRPVEFTRTRLACLAAALKDKYRDSESINARIFDAKDAAASYSGPSLVEDTPAHRAIMRHMHAIYHYDRGSGEEYILITPIGMDRDGPFDMRLDLPFSAGTTCHYNLRDRCVIALQQPSYPDDAAKKGVSAEALLAGTCSTRRNPRTGSRRVGARNGGQPHKRLRSQRRVQSQDVET